MKTKNFFEYYNSINDRTKKRILKNKILQACNVSVYAFHSWFQRGSVPVWHQNNIVSVLKEVEPHTQHSKEMLFPYYMDNLNIA